MNTKLLNNLTYTYLSIPTIIFLIGWCKPIISIPITILILLSIIYRIKNNKINILKEIKDNKKNNNNYINNKFNNYIFIRNRWIYISK